MMWGCASSASNFLGLSAFSASHTLSESARTACRRLAMSTLPSRRTDVVLRGLASMSLILEVVTEQFQIASVELGDRILQFRGVIVPVIRTARLVHLIERS